jgi:hypothetical protein
MEQTTFKGHPALYQVVTQTLPARTDAMKRTIAGKVLTHAIYVIDYDGYVVLLWVMGASDGAINAVDDNNRDEMSKQTWKPQVEFVNSFQLYPAKK